MEPTKRRRRRGTPVPRLHLVTIYICGALIVFFGGAYLIAPASKESMLSTITVSLITFMAGKLSNSFGKPVAGEYDDEKGAGEE